MDGKKILPYYSEAGLDVDYEWQIPQLKFWIKNLKRKKQTWFIKKK